MALTLLGAGTAISKSIAPDAVNSLTANAAVQHYVYCAGYVLVWGTRSDGSTYSYRTYVAHDGNPNRWAATGRYSY